MRLNEFNGHGEKNDIEKVRDMHPEVYQFMEKQIGHMALEQQTHGSMSEMASGHSVMFQIKPSAGLGNTKAGLDQDGISYEVTEFPSGPMIVAQTPVGEARIELQGHQQGNMTETWRFHIPVSYDDRGERIAPMDNYAKQRGRR